jgi:hypothetical protein
LDKRQDHGTSYFRCVWATILEELMRVVVAAFAAPSDPARLCGWWERSAGPATDVIARVVGQPLTSA